MAFINFFYRAIGRFYNVVNNARCKRIINILYTGCLLSVKFNILDSVNPLLSNWCDSTVVDFIRYKLRQIQIKMDHWYRERFKSEKEKSGIM